MPNLYYSARARLLRQEMDWRDGDNVIQAPFHTDGFDKQVGFDTSQGAEGWFSP
jgi:hypothetical protein